jgi:hypothetical protein
MSLGWFSLFEVLPHGPNLCKVLIKSDLGLDLACKLLITKTRSSKVFFPESLYFKVIEGRTFPCCPVFDLYIYYSGWSGTNLQLYSLLFEEFRCLRGLTCVFWAENGKRKNFISQDQWIEAFARYYSRFPRGPFLLHKLEFRLPVDHNHLESHYADHAWG